MDNSLLHTWKVLTNQKKRKKNKLIAWCELIPTKLRILNMNSISLNSGGQVPMEVSILPLDQSYPIFPWCQFPASVAVCEWFCRFVGKTRGGQVFRLGGSLVVVVLLFFFGFGVGIILYTIFLWEFCFVLSLSVTDQIYIYIYGFP